MKKILIVTLEYPPQVGGIATYIHDIAMALDPEHVVVLAPEIPGSHVWDSKQPHTIVRKKLLFPKFIWPRWIRLVWYVLRTINREGIEVLMIHHVLPVGYAGIVAKVIKKVPFLLFSHGTDLVAGTATKWKRKMVKKVSSRAEQIVFNSESLKRRYLRVLPQFESTSLVLYPCPDVDFLEAPPSDQVETLRDQYALRGKKVLLSVGRMVDGKGFPHLARHIPDLLKKVPHLVWLIIGDGPKRKTLDNFVRHNKLQNIVRFVGSVDHKEIKPFFYLADVFALFTHPDDGLEEGLGLVFLEAAASGLPAVAGRSGGVEEAVLHEETGYVYDVRIQTAQMLEKIVQLLNNKENATAIGVAARERVKKEFVWGVELRKLDQWIG